MAKSDEANATDGEESTYREYVLGVRIVAVRRPDETDTRYRFEAPEHVGTEFDDPETAELYADVYFDTNGFQEEGTGDRGIPPEVIQAGKDTLAAYFLTRPGVDRNWMASFYGTKPEKIKRYVEWVRERAEEVRTGVADRNMGEDRGGT